MKVIEIKDLVKKYGNNIAVDNMNLEINEGEIYGLLGPNGAGKSTTISIICSLLCSSSGSVTVLGKDIKKSSLKVKRDMGLVPQNIAVYKEFTAYENVKLFGELYGLRGKLLKDSIDKALKFVGLSDEAKSKAKTFSGGMMRRLNIACAIVHEPKIIIMDEPTVGIDPQSRNHILNSVKKLNENGATIIYTTHYMEEVEAICSRIAIVDKGKIIVEGTKEELKEIVSNKKSLHVSVDDAYKINMEQLKAIKGIEEIDLDGNKITINTNKDVNNLDIVIKNITDCDAKILDLGFKEITLETVFLTLTGRKLRD